MLLSRFSDTFKGKRGALRRFLSMAALPASLIVFELLLHWVGGITDPLHVGVAATTAAAVGAFFTLLCTLSGAPRVNRWLVFAVTELFTLLFLLNYFLQNSFQTFMTPAMILEGTGDVVTDFSAQVITILTRGFPEILLFHIPSILFLLLHKKTDYSRALLPSVILAAVVLVCGTAGLLLPRLSAEDAVLTREAYYYDSAVRRFGSLTALRLELLGKDESEEEKFVVESVDLQAIQPTVTVTPSPEPATPAETAPETEEPPDAQPTESAETAPEAAEEPEPVIEYGNNVMDIDFDALMEATGDTTLRSMHEYVASQTPSRQNAYTGMFAGKNLILITAEAFSAEVIDPVRTPTLYRLANRGIVFEDYYQPAWGGSTSTGEYSMLMGLAPVQNDAMQRTIGRNMYLTMGNQLQRLGYFSAAYHDGTYTYYNRNNTHCNLGYDTFTALGNGLEAGVDPTKWPESDCEMMQFTLEQYIDQQPFSIYYMTVSGHCAYHFYCNAMAEKNAEAVADMDCSDTVKAYYACNMELEYAMEYLVGQLEEAGIADDTVIVLTSDHYPYGLTKSTTWTTDRDYLPELYGYPDNTNTARDHNALIIWSGCLEDSDPIVVSTPTYSLDILPTLSNLFGLTYDSRLLVGRDALSDTPALVLWNDYDFLTEYGYYDAGSGTFTPNEGVEVSEEYVAYYVQEVRNKLNFSSRVLSYNYYNILFGE